MRNLPIVLALAAAATLPAGGVAAQSGTLGLELNKATTVETGCRVTFVADNATGTALDAASYEVAVFDAEGVVDRLLILEFGPLVVDQTKVVQFDMTEAGCESISRVLVNTVAECTPDAEADLDCLGMLETSTRTEIAFGF